MKERENELMNLIIGSKIAESEYTSNSANTKTCASTDGHTSTVECASSVIRALNCKGRSLSGLQVQDIAIEGAD